MRTMPVAGVMMSINLATSSFCALLVVVSAQGPCGAEDAVDPKLPSLRMVFFTPRNVEPPSNAEERLTQFARYAENFFVTWLTRWGYEPARKRIFQWRPDGNVEVLFAKGDQPADQYKDGSFRPQMIQGLVREHNIPRNGNIWWIFVYLGDPPARFEKYRGAGDSRGGGWAILNYDSSPGEIRLNQDIAAGFHHDVFLKGSIHELGHALGLPHLGPRLKQDLGNSLMGPVTRIWEQHRGPTDRRGHLSEGSAAMLWKHPLFSGTSQDRGVMPTVALTDYQARHDRRKNEIEVRGRLIANRTAHSVVVVDDMDEKPGEYWRRAYVGRIAEDGAFQVTIDEPVPCGGTYRIAFCFDNGIVTGDGKKAGLEGAIERGYGYSGAGYRFE
jgi:hypothetical protein